MQPRKKNITLFFEYFQDIHFVKDPFMVPYYLGKTLGYSVTIIYPALEENRDLPSEYKGVKLIPIKVYGNWHTNPFIRYIHIYRYIRKNAKNIDIFMRFFLPPPPSCPPRSRRRNCPPSMRPRAIR